MKRILLTVVILCSVSFVFAQVHPAKIFSDSMVLQRDRPIPVWGKAGKGEKITVQFNKQAKTTVAANDGHWRIDLGAEKAGGPYPLIISGSDKVIIKDILVGDVWICSGQSNMEWTVNNSKNKEIEVAAANFPRIRHIKIANAIADRPKEDIGNNSGWHSASPAFAGNFTAVGYFFAKELYQKTNIPIGLINTTWGGTDVETWTSRDALAKNAEFKELMTGLPSLNLDSMMGMRKKAMQTKIEKLQGGLPDASTITQWKEFSFNDKDWQTMKVPGLWEQQALPDFDGTVWFRKTITLSASQAVQGADLLLGTIDDADETYINGVKVGSTNGYNLNRIYIIAPRVLKEGKNVIAIKVDDTGGGGGLYGQQEGLLLRFKNGELPLAGEWKYRVASIGGSSSVGPNSYPSLLYNAMINPLTPFAIKGVIWYQGENNAGRAYQYRTAFPLMITDWRNRWKQGDFPFYFVQLASFNSGGGNSTQGSNWAELREAQTLTLSLPNTGMAVTTDIGEPKDIHPKNKQDVGKRLAAIALNKLYGKANVYCGPVYQSMKTEGSKAILNFSNIASGLTMRAGAVNLEGFEVAGADRKFYPAVGVINGDKIILSSPEVTMPVAVHYAWADDAGNANLFNKEGFPALPFRTDQWKGITADAKYRITLK
ncbi:MAG: sialate O-acetylesterase [Bacteroidota bacterium]